MSGALPSFCMRKFMPGLSHLSKSGQAEMVDVSAKPSTARMAIAEGRVVMQKMTLDAALAGNAKKGDVFAAARIPGIKVEAAAKTLGQTGVEMEALTAAAIACLTIYDMLKAIDRSMTIEGIALLQKTGGKSGEYSRSGKPQPAALEGDAGRKSGPRS